MVRRVQPIIQLVTFAMGLRVRTVLIKDGMVHIVAGLSDVVMVSNLSVWLLLGKHLVVLVKTFGEFVTTYNIQWVDTLGNMSDSI